MSLTKRISDPLLGWHLLGWTLFSVYTYRDGMADWQANWILGAEIMANASIFYFLYLLVCPRIQPVGNGWLVLVAIPLGAVGFVLFRYLFQEVLLLAVVGFGNYETNDYGFYFRDNILRGLYTVIASLIAYLLLNLRRGKARRKELEAEKTKTELAFLRSQVNPHFLFNTLSYLHTEAYMVDTKLAGNILRLSDVLRYATQNSLVERRTITEEVQLLNNYIEIFRQRFEGRCYLNFLVEGTGLEQLIEPLLLMPFVENAFKHGQYVHPDTPIQIRLVVSEGSLEFRCCNYIKRQQKDESSGIGLENTRRRLALLYPGRHTLAIDEKENIFTASLVLHEI